MSPSSTPLPPLQGRDPATAIVGATVANGCAIVTPLPTTGQFSRVAFKYYFAVTPSQWTAISSLLAVSHTITAGHVLCGSTIYFQQYPSGTSTHVNLSPTLNPSWLAPSAAGLVCYTNVFDPLIG